MLRIEHQPRGATSPETDRRLAFGVALRPIGVVAHDGQVFRHQQRRDIAAGHEPCARMAAGSAAQRGANRAVFPAPPRTGRTPLDSSGSPSIPASPPTRASSMQGRSARSPDYAVAPGASAIARSHAHNRPRPPRAYASAPLPRSSCRAIVPRRGTALRIAHDAPMRGMNIKSKTPVSNRRRRDIDGERCELRSVTRDRRPSP